VTAGKIVIPRELAPLLPPTVRMFADQFPFSKWFGVALAIFLLFGPNGDRNGSRYLLTPLVCPLLTALYYRLLPPNIYRGYSARISGLLDFNERNNDAQRFLALFESVAARSFLWRVARNVALLEFTVMAVLTLACALTGTLTWSVSSSWLWQGFIGCCLGSFIAVGSDVFAWVLRRWVDGKDLVTPNQPLNVRAPS